MSRAGICPRPPPERIVRRGTGERRESLSNVRTGLFAFLADEIALVVRRQVEPLRQRFELRAARIAAVDEPRHPHLGGHVWVERRGLRPIERTLRAPAEVRLPRNEPFVDDPAGLVGVNPTLERVRGGLLTRLVGEQT